MNALIFIPAGKTWDSRQENPNWWRRSSTCIVSDWSLSCELSRAGKNQSHGIARVGQNPFAYNWSVIFLRRGWGWGGSPQLMGMSPPSMTDLNPTHPFSCIPSSSSSSSKWPKGSDDNDTMLFRITRLSLLDVKRSWSWKWLYRTLHTLKSTI